MMHTIFKSTLALVLILALATVAWGESALEKEVVSQCQAASKLIQDKGIEAGIAAVGDKEGPFVTKDTYVFLMDMDAKMLAHPFAPEMTKRDDLLQVADSDGKPFFVEFIKVANSSGDGWVDYMWPKPNEKEPASKSSYILRVPGTQYFVGAGIYK